MASTPINEDAATPVVPTTPDTTPPTTPDDAADTSMANNFSVIDSVAVVEEKNNRFRRTMEDTHVVSDELAGDPNQALFGVFDGHGGKQAAEYCRENVPSYVAEEMANDESATIFEAITRAFVRIDNELESNQVMHAGCTAAVVVIKQVDGGRTLYAANCGDARVVLCRGGTGIPLTWDHKGTDPDEEVRIRDAGGFVSNGRVNGMLAVTRAIGDVLMKNYVVSTPYTREVTLEAEDKWCIIACDGIWDVINDQAACDLINDEDDAEAAANLLLTESLKLGTTDNVTCMVLKL